MDYAQLRARAQSILQSDICNRIRFKMDNIRIQSFMFGYIGSAVGSGRIKIVIGEGSQYKPDSNTLYLPSEDAPDYTIVHEATHAVIDATNIGLSVTKSTHEVAAYLAETVYSIQKTGEAEYLDIPRMTPPVARLARQLIEFNRNLSATFLCPSSLVAEIKAIYEASPNGRNNVKRMDGIGD